MSTKTLQITLQHQRDNRWPVSATLNNHNKKPKHVDGELKLKKDWETTLIELALQTEDYGIYVGKALFHSEILDLTKDALTGEDSVQLFLIIESQRLKHLRWERLYFPDDGEKWTSLAQHQRLILSYYVPSLLTRQYPVVSRPDLEAFTFIASPVDEYNGYKPFDAQHFANITKQSLGKIESNKLIYEAKDSNWETFKETINKQHFPILHIVAHGMYWEKPDKTETFLIFLDKDQKPEMISSEEFINTLRIIDKLPNLIFLSSCETATPEAAKGSREHFARRLIDELATPAVIAMSDKVSVETAEILTTHFYEHLYQEGKVDRALAKAGLDLLDRDDRYLPVLYQSLGNRPLFSIVTEALEHLGKERLEYGIERFEPLIEERAPYFRPEYEGLVEQLNTEQPEHKVLHELEQLCYEVAEISFAALAQKEDPPEYDDQCPFPGMQAFKANKKGIDYRKYFFGREKKVAELVERVLETEIFAIKGASGSGKSSIVYAGILPALKKYYNEKKQELQIRSMRPGCIVRTTQELDKPKRRLQKHIASLNPDEPAVLFIDQFEELFTLCRFDNKNEKQETIRKEFLEELFNLPEQYSKLKIIITIRADFVGDTANYINLKDVMQNQSELLAPMNIDELRTAIDKQANSVGLIFEQGLAHRILSEVETEAGAMPLLQHLLLTLWTRRKGRYLRTAEYETIGGVRKAISETADKLFDSYNDEPEKQFYLRNTFLRLTRPDTNRQKELGAAYKDTKQRVSKSTLYPSDADSKVIDDLIKQLADKRLITTYDDDIEIAHESLIQYWDRLRDWLKDRSLIVMQQELANAAQVWVQNRKDRHAKSYLTHSGVRLNEIEKNKQKKMLFLNQDEELYLQACLKKDKAEARRQKMINWGALVVLVLFCFSILATYLANEQKNNADNRLAETYFQEGMESRDNERQEIGKANHYFAKALDIVAANQKREKVLFSYLDSKQRIYFKLKFILKQKKSIDGSTIFVDNQRILTWTLDTVHIWNASNGETIGKPMGNPPRNW